jgi:hypothetical protein
VIGQLAGCSQLNCKGEGAREAASGEWWFFDLGAAFGITGIDSVMGEQDDKWLRERGKMGDCWRYEYLAKKVPGERAAKP